MVTIKSKTEIEKMSEECRIENMIQKEIKKDIKLGYSKK